MDQLERDNNKYYTSKTYTQMSMAKNLIAQPTPLNISNEDAHDLNLSS